MNDHEMVHVASPVSEWGLKARAWINDAFLPFWLERAAHPAGGFRERLALDGQPLNDPHSRVRLQARQTFVFAHASLGGWRPDAAAEMTARGVECLLKHCRRSDGLFGRHVALGHGLVDDTFQLYDTAFAIFALAWASRALGDKSLIEEIDRTLDALDARKRGAHGGYVEVGRIAEPRLQNPHMHLLEALLAVERASGRTDHGARADELVGLMQTRFVHSSGRLLEAFSSDWRPLSEDNPPIEPGHEFEWVWLLSEWSDARGRALPEVAHRLYANALTACDARGLTPQSIRLDGAAGNASRRTWPQTEALKAHLVMAGRREYQAAERAAQTAFALWADYLDPAPPGGWIDQYDATGRPDVSDMTAATGYHLLVALSLLGKAA